MIYQKVHKNMILRVLFSMLSFVLILILIMNAGIIDCFAIAGVDDALFWILVAICSACGVTFVSVEAAHAGTDTLWSNLGSGVQNLLSSKAEEIGRNLTGIAALATIGVTFLAEQWAQITQGIIATFGTYTSFDVVMDITNSLDNSILSKDNYLQFQWYATSTNYNKVSCNNFIFQFYGSESSAIASVPTVISNKVVGKNLDGIISVTVGDWTCYRVNTYKSTAPVPFTLAISYSYNAPSCFLLCSQQFSLDSDTLYYKGYPVTATYINNPPTVGYRLSTSVCPDIGKSLDLGDSICPDGIFTKKTWTEWLTNLGNGAIGDDIPSVGALPGNPSIDTTSYPGNDTWHDGSINDDVAIGSPSIGISIPTTDDDVITLNPDKARDYSNTTVKDKDLTDTDDKTETDDKDKTGTKPGGLPALSLPEVLFKKKFPFCLPWDLYSIFVILNAEPVAPKFDIPFKFDRLGIDYTFSIDLSDYDDLAKISRVSLSIMFVIALILLSRRLIGAE